MGLRIIRIGEAFARWLSENPVSARVAHALNGSYFVAAVGFSYLGHTYDIAFHIPVLAVSIYTYIYPALVVLYHVIIGFPSDSTNIWVFLDFNGDRKFFGVTIDVLNSVAMILLNIVFVYFLSFTIYMNSKKTERRR